MKTFNEGFRESLRGIRDIYAIVSYIGIEGTNILTTEGNYNIDTENLLDIGTEKGAYNIENDAIYSVRPYYNASLFKTICYGLELECKFAIPEGTEINVMIGTYNDTTQAVEYMEYGYFLIKGQPEYNADFDTYTLQAYDHMLDCMISFKDNPLGITYPIKHKEFLEAICNKFGWNYVIGDYANKDFMVSDLYSETDYTYRDVLDDLLIATGKNLMFDTRKTLRFRTIEDTEETIIDDDMKSSNVSIKDYYGPLNKLTSTTDDITYTIGEDTASITLNGKTEYDIGTNLLIASDTTGSTYDNIFNSIKGLEYYTFDIDTCGLLVFEPLDKVVVEHKDIEYPIVLFNGNTKCVRGLTESISADIPEQNVETYTTSTPRTEDVKNAIVNVDRLKGEIVLKVDSSGNIAEVELSADADTGTEISISADKVDFTAHEFDLATDDISITSDNVSITNDGIELSNGAVIVGENGLMSQTLYVGTTYNNQITGITGYGPMGFSVSQDYYSSSPSFIIDKLWIDCYIPANFIIKSAVVHLYHSPIYWANSLDGGNSWTGYTRYMKLYKANSLSTQKWTIDLASLNLSSDNLSYTEISGAFGSNGFTGDPNTSTGTDSIDIKNYLTTGRNRLEIHSTSDRPRDYSEMYQKTGSVFAVLDIIGWTPYTR